MSSPDDGTKQDVMNRDERLLAAIAHGSAVFNFSLFGMIIPLRIYWGAKAQSKNLAFHAVQAFLYNAVVMLFMISFFMLLLLILVFSGLAFELSLADILSIPMCSNFPLMFIYMVSFWHIFAGLPLGAAISVIQGKEFRYPLIGWLAERWVEARIPQKK